MVQFRADLQWEPRELYRNSYGDTAILSDGSETGELYVPGIVIFERSFPIESLITDKKLIFSFGSILKGSSLRFASVVQLICFTILFELRYCYEGGRGRSASCYGQRRRRASAGQREIAYVYSARYSLCL